MVDALVSVTFGRNALAAMVVFDLVPSISSLGPYMFICAACIGWAGSGLTVPTIIWGKKWRGHIAEVFDRHVLQGGSNASSMWGVPAALI